MRGPKTGGGCAPARYPVPAGGMRRRGARGNGVGRRCKALWGWRPVPRSWAGRRKAGPPRPRRPGGSPRRWPLRWWPARRRRCPRRSAGCRRPSCRVPASRSSGGNPRDRARGPAPGYPASPAHRVLPALRPSSSPPPPRARRDRRRSRPKAGILPASNSLRSLARAFSWPAVTTSMASPCAQPSSASATISAMLSCASSTSTTRWPGKKPVAFNSSVTRAGSLRRSDAATRVRRISASAFGLAKQRLDQFLPPERHAHRVRAVDQDARRRRILARGRRQARRGRQASFHPVPGGRRQPQDDLIGKRKRQAFAGVILCRAGGEGRGDGGIGGERPGAVLKQRLRPCPRRARRTARHRPG